MSRIVQFRCFFLILYPSVNTHLFATITDCNMTRNTAIIAMLLALCIKAVAAPYQFKNFSDLDGLPDNSITCITQDSFGFIWVGTKDGLCRYDGKRFNLVHRVDFPLANRSITALHADRLDRLWVASSDGFGFIDLHTDEVKVVGKTGIVPTFNFVEDAESNIWLVNNNSPMKVDANTLKLTLYPAEKYFQVSRCCSTANDEVWFSSRDGNVYHYLPEADSFESIEVLTDQEKKAGEYLLMICAVDDERLLVSTSKEDIIRVTPSRKSVETLFVGNQDKVGASVRSLSQGPISDYWVATDKGLYVFSQNGSFSHIVSDKTDVLSLTNDNIRYLYRDASNRMWLGTFYSGLNLYSPSILKYYRNFSATSSESLGGSTVRAIREDLNRNIWIGTEDGYLNVLSPDGKITTLDSSSGLDDCCNFHALRMYHGLMYVATYDKGIYSIDPDTKRVVKHYSFDDVHVICMLRTRSDMLLAGTDNGVYELDLSTGTFVQVKSTEKRFIHALAQDAKGTIWVGIYGNGVWILDMQKDNFYPIDPNAREEGRNVYVTSLFADSNGIIWASTEGNGLLWIEKSKSGEGYETGFITRENGFLSNICCAIAEDGNGYLWISTNRGIFCIDPKTHNIKDSIYELENGIGNFYRYGSAITSTDGEIYMGTTEGMISFNPLSLSASKAPNIYITDIFTGGTTNGMELTEKGRSALETKHITLKKKEASSITISFAAFASSIYHPLKYEYRLYKKGGRTLVQEQTMDNFVTFTGLRPRRYLFYVNEAGSDDSDTAGKLVFTIKAPFYESKLFITLYSLALLALLLFYRQNSNRRKEASKARMIEHMEAEKQKEIYDAKINFFTNITHEIRTPLTLIKMPLDKIVENKEYTPESKSDLLTIKSNTDRLLALTNQLLDLRKMENKQLSLDFVKGDIAGILRNSCNYFTSVTQERHIAFDTDIPEGVLNINCAPTSVDKIFVNLISNAVKYCKGRVTVSMRESTDGSAVVVDVFSDGDAIKGDDRELIFESFYQAHNTESSNIIGSSGTGLGLPLARSLAELHGGSLVLLENNDDEGNVFQLTLPKNQKAEPKVVAESKSEENPSEPDFSSADANGRYTVLVAEDDMSLNDYLKKELSKEYFVIQASNGEEAIALLEKSKVDLVISDIMMPLVDGCSLCNHVKSHIEYSHIPVVLMTAAVGVDTRIETLNVGADAYIEKPFSMALLMANVANLFKNREITFRQFSESPLSHFNGLKVNNMDDDFMNNLHMAVMDHISEENFSVDELITLLGTSRSTLFRKVKANTGMNISDFIKVCKLKKAAELLATQKYRVNEVAYMVGYSSPSYFAGLFLKQFNISPSDFTKSIKEQGKA